MIVIEQCALHGYDLVPAVEAGRDIGFVVVMPAIRRAIMLLALDEAGGADSGAGRPMGWLTRNFAPIDPMGGRAMRFWRIGLAALADVQRTDDTFALWVNNLRVRMTMSVAEQAIVAGLGPYAQLFGTAARAPIGFAAFAGGAKELMPHLSGQPAGRIADVLVRAEYERQARELVTLLPPRC